MPYEIYVISNSDLFREGLNAIAAFCQSEGFKTASWMGAVIGILFTATSYVKSQDVTVFLKWIAGYFFVFGILLGVPSTVAIINVTDSSVPAMVVDNVPLGIALPAHLITALGYGFSSDLETAFALPDETQYNQTGMLFGSNLFRLSLAAKIDDPKIMNEMNNYVRSCVVGDVLINHKYSFNDLLNSQDIWALMTSQPSPIRGIFINGTFNTCVQAAATLTSQMNTYATDTDPTHTNTALSFLSKFIPSEKPYAQAAISNMLANTYNYFNANSKTASNILRQNIAINAFRSGIKNYAAETGSVAGMENIANTIAMNNTRMAWATSRHIGIQTLPLMQVVLLLLLICIFPLVAVLTLIPNIGINVFKNYIYSLLWLETWPVMFTVLNMAMNFYIHSSSNRTVTLSNINLLAQEHSDIAGVAGYLVLAIPFLSMGIVKGMAFTFNNAAQYLGGMMHSIAQGSASSVAMGNYSLGNISTNNATSNMLSANKHDTNFSSMHGMSTQQFGNAATVTATPTGSSIYHTGAGMSQLAVSANAAHSAATSLSHQVDSSLSSAFQHSTQYSDSMAHNQSLSSTSTAGVSTQVDHAMNTVHSLTNSLAQKEGISSADAFKKLTSASLSLNSSFSASQGLDVFGNGAKVTEGGSVSAETNASSTHDGSYSVAADRNISHSDTQNFTQALHTIQNYSNSHSSSDSQSTTANAAMSMGADLSTAQRESNSAQYIESNSSAINTNFSQAFANYVQANYPEQANSILSATGDSPLLAKQQGLANQFVQTHAAQLANQYGANSQNIQQHPVSSKYATENYASRSSGIMSGSGSVGVNKDEFSSMSSAVQNHIQSNSSKITSADKHAQKNTANFKSETQQSMKTGKGYAQKGVANHIVHGVDL
jgi:conjugal transfer mating pair stabilization protein TraG